MTAPNPPAVFYEAPAANPAGLGLLEAATPGTLSTDQLRRLASGVEVRTPNCGTAFGTWDVRYCYVAPDGTVKNGDRPADAPAFEPVLTWAYDECDPQESDEQVEARARQLHRLHDPLLVESHFAERVLADADAPTAVGDIVAAVSALEEDLGDTGMLGVIHASRRFAAYAAQAELIVRSGALLKTPLGHTWVFGAGYAGVLGNTLVATGPVTSFRPEAWTRFALEPSINRRLAVVERLSVVTYECFAGAVTVTPPAP